MILESESRDERGLYMPETCRQLARTSRLTWHKWLPAWDIHSQLSPAGWKAIRARSAAESRSGEGDPDSATATKPVQKHPRRRWRQKPAGCGWKTSSQNAAAFFARTHTQKSAPR
jgi:hypothetical protein